MKWINGHLSYGVGAAALISLFWLARPVESSAQASGEGTQRAIGAGTTIVHSKFGGQIFGFDVDQNGAEGVLSENKLLANGNVLAAVETFDQKTGKILKVVSETENQDNFLTQGIQGTSVGLVEQEIVTGLYVTDRIYDVMDPLKSNAITGTWTPPLANDDIIIGLSRNQASTTTAVLYFENDGNNFSSFVFGSNVGANTFEPVVNLTNPIFGFNEAPQVAYDSVTNQAVVASSNGEVGGPPPVFALVDLTTGVVNTFNGIPGPPPFRQGSINGLAVDSEDGIACTTTEVDFRVEFYDLAKLKQDSPWYCRGRPGRLRVDRTWNTIRSTSCFLWRSRCRARRRGAAFRSITRRGSWWSR